MSELREPRGVGCEHRREELSHTELTETTEDKSLKGYRLKGREAGKPPLVFVIPVKYVI